MTDWGGPPQPIAPLYISSFNTLYTAAQELRFGQAIPTVSVPGTWVADLALYIPLSIPFEFYIQRFFWCNGSTVTGNVDVGIYSPGGARLCSIGTTAQSGASTGQYASLSTAFLLTPGQYYWGFVCSGSTNALVMSTTWTAVSLRLGGCLQQALGSASLPSSMTPAVVSNAVYPMVSMTQLASGF